MTIHATLLALSSLTIAPAMALPASQSGLLAIKVGRAETIGHGTLEHAVILIEDGKIVMIGEDLPIDRGIPVLERDPEWVAMPGLVNAYSRTGMDSEGTNDAQPQILAANELHPGGKREYREALEAGVTTMGLYPPGNGIPGQAVAIRTRGTTREEMILAESAYLKIILRSTAAAKKMLRDGFAKADRYIEREKKEREKWEKEKEKHDKAVKDKKEGVGELEPYEPPEPDPDVKAFLALRSGELRALIGVTDASDYLHAIDAIGQETFSFDLRIPIQRETNVFYVASEIGRLGCRVVMEPEISLHPNTMRQRNLPAEFARAGAKLVLIPRSDSTDGHREWLRDAGQIVAAGLERETALRAMTLEAAGLLGLGERLGSLEVGKDANLIFLDGDPFETGTQIQAVMIEGRFVYGEVGL